MEAHHAIELGQQALWTALILSAPALLAGLAVALVLSVLQAMTQVQDPTLSLVPKILVVALVVVVCLPWLVDRLLEYSHELIAQVPHLVGGG